MTGQKETQDVTLTPYVLDLGEVEAAAQLLGCPVDGEQLLDALEVMHATETNEAVAYPLQEDLAEQLLVDPSYLDHRRAQLGYLR